MLPTTTALIAQIRRNLADPGDITSMIYDARSACDEDEWEAALTALNRTETPLVLDGARHDTTSAAAGAIDDAAHAVWNGIRDLVEPEIAAEAEAFADQAVEDQAEGLRGIRYWQRACHPRQDNLYRLPLDQIHTCEQFRDAFTVFMTYVVQRVLHHAVTAELLKSQLTADDYRALTWPFEDLTSDASKER